MEADCHREVVELHRFFEDWFIGRLDTGDDSFDRFAGVMATDFEIVSPGGATTPRAPLLDGLRRAHGSRPPGNDAFRILVEDFRYLFNAGPVHVVSYRERQIAGDEDRSRLSTAVLREKEGCPNGLEWLRVHETWIVD